MTVAKTSLRLELPVSPGRYDHFDVDVEWNTDTEIAHLYVTLPVIGRMMLGILHTIPITGLQILSTMTVLAGDDAAQQRIRDQVRAHVRSERMKGAPPIGVTTG